MVNKNQSNTIRPLIKVEKETDKAVQISYTAWNKKSYSEQVAYLWLPKSQVSITDGYVTNMPTWLLSSNDRKTVSYGYTFNSFNKYVQPTDPLYIHACNVHE